MTLLNVDLPEPFWLRADVSVPHIADNRSSDPAVLIGAITPPNSRRSGGMRRSAVPRHSSGALRGAGDVTNVSDRARAASSPRAATTSTSASSASVVPSRRALATCRRSPGA